uniref:Uncharacterized protein n=1 Tax=Aegilops tauschii subsp. strangulata TaxID=200361 RepID=A0A453MFD2_AEGTS
MDGLKWVRTPSARDKIRCWVPHPPKSKVSSHTDVSCLERAHYTYHGNKIYFCIFVIIKHIRCLVFGMCKLNSSIIGVNLPINKVNGIQYIIHDSFLDSFYIIESDGHHY